MSNDKPVFNKTHFGSMYGVPVWFDMTDSELPGVESRYWGTGLVLDVMEGMMMFCCSVRCMFDPEFEPMFPMLIKGEIGHDGQLIKYSKTQS